MFNFITDIIPPDILSYLKLAFSYIYFLMPIWLPAIFISTTFRAFLQYKRLQFWQKEGSMLLEIKLPKEISKSPAAMEVVLNALYQPSGESTWIDRIWKGQTRSWFSLEIVSTGGNIKFFIWTKPKHRNIIESQIYSQYPGVEIYEAEDYTKPFYYDPQKFDIWGCEFALTKADPYPIKTYIDYGLDQDPKEEYKIDPMTPLLEFMGSLTAGHNAWIQIIIRAHKKRRVMDVFGEKENAWEEQAKKEIDKIIEKLKVAKEAGGFPRIPTKGEAEVIAALERSVSKIGFDVGIRGMYIADKDKFSAGNGSGGLGGCFKQFNAGNLNGFKMSGWFGIFDYPWEEWFNAKEKLKPKILEEYKMRRYFFSPLKDKKVWWKNIYSKPFVLNSEELATIFHFPGAVASTPTFEKIPSVKAKAPPNLPV